MLTRQIIGLVTAFVGLISLVIAIFIAYSVGGPFFEAMGADNAVYGFNSGDVINFGGALAIFVFALLVIPVALALRFFFAGSTSQGPPGR